MRGKIIGAENPEAGGKRPQDIKSFLAKEELGCFLTRFVIEELPIRACFLIGPRDLLTDAFPGNERTKRKVTPARDHSPDTPLLHTVPSKRAFFFFLELGK